jgi:hypothetical protein
MFVERLTAVLPGVLREDVSQAQTKAAVTTIHVPEVLTVRDFHAVLHPHNVQWRRSCARAQNVRFVVTRTGNVANSYYILFYCVSTVNLLLRCQIFINYLSLYGNM